MEVARKEEWEVVALGLMATRDVVVGQEVQLSSLEVEEREVMEEEVEEVEEK